MRHRKRILKLGRKRDHRKGLIRNLVNDLILRGKLQTTKSRGKALRIAVDRVITIAKKGTDMNVIRRLKQYGIRESVSRKLLMEYAKRYEKRNSGFTTVSPVKRRKGDNAPIVQITLL